MLRDWEHSAIPASYRQPLYKVLAVWVNFVFVPVFIGFAFGLGRSMSPWQFLAAIFFGSAILAFCSTISGIIGQRTGLSAGLLVSHVFGSGAGKVVALLVSLLIIGWDSFSLDLIGTEVVNNLGHPEYRWLYIVLPAILFAATATVGFRALAPMSLISIPVMAGLMIYALGLAANGGAGVAISATESSTPFPVAVTQTVGLFALGSILCSPDIQRFCKTPTHAVVVGGVTFIVALPFLLIVGGLLALNTGTPSLLTAFASLNLLWIGLFAFLLLSWSCCDNDYYSAGLGVAAVTGLKKAWLVPPIAGIAATIASLGIGQYLQPWLILMTTITLPVAGVFIADFLILRRQVDSAPNEAVRVTALVSWALGAAVSYLTTQAEVGIPPIQGMLTACIAQYALAKIAST
jgi:cytosine permease